VPAQRAEGSGLRFATGCAVCSAQFAAYLAAMKRTMLLTLILAGCSGSGLSTSSGPNGETIVGNDVSVQVTGAANPNAAFTLAQKYCRKNDRAARAVSQSGTTSAFDCVKGA
jgi:hypothetical protein